MGNDWFTAVKVFTWRFIGTLVGKDSLEDGSTTNGERGKEICGLFHPRNKGGSRHFMEKEKRKEKKRKGEEERAVF